MELRLFKLSFQYYNKVLNILFIFCDVDTDPVPGSLNIVDPMSRLLTSGILWKGDDIWEILLFSTFKNLFTSMSTYRMFCSVPS